MKQILFFLLITNCLYSQWKLTTPINENSKIRKIEITPNNGLYFLDSRFDSSSNGVLLKSSDEGQTWIKIIGGGKDFQMINDNYGYVVLNDKIAKSTDGFENLTLINLPSSGFKQLFFINQNLGFVGGLSGVFFKTIDGGENWTDISLNTTEDVNDIFFIDENIGFAVTSSMKVFKTTNQGANWTETDLGIGHFHSIKFFDNNFGLITGNGGNIFKTNDGGENWIALNSNVSTSTIIYDIEKIDNTLVAVGSGSKVIYSNDNGNTWGNYTVGLYTDLYSVISFNNQLLVGASGHSFLVNNYSSWSYFKQGLYNSKLTEISFADDIHGIVTGGEDFYSNSVVIRTNNGGLTWFREKFSNDSSKYPDVYLAPNGNGILAVDNHYELTNNFGDTWTYGGQTSPVSGIRSCFIKQNGDRVLGTTEGIFTLSNGVWNQISSIEDVYRIYFYDNQIGFVASYGTIYRTLDGGVTWSVVLGTSTNSIGQKIYMTNAETIYVDNFASYDGGETWTSIFPIFYNDYHFYNENIGLRIDSNYNIYKTEDGGNNWWQIVENNSSGSITSFNKTIFFEDKIIGIADNSEVYVLFLENNVLNTDDTDNLIDNINLVEIYPNPVKDILNIQSEKHINDISLYSINGQLVPVVLNQDFTVDLSTLDKGIYFLKINLGSHSIVKKIIKK